MYTKMLALLIAANLILNVACYGSNPGMPELGRCPRFPSKEGFSTEQFQGGWYMGYQFTYKYNPCTTFNFTANSAYSMDFTSDVRTSRSLDLTLSGKTTSSNVSDPAVMIMSWDFYPAQVEYLTVVDTDYENYAVLVSCSDYAIFHTKVAFVLSRTENSLASAFLARAKAVLERFMPVYIYRKSQPCYFSENWPKNETLVKNLNIEDTVQQIQDFIWKFI